jgi:hypothetical protein
MTHSTRVCHRFFLSFFSSQILTSVFSFPLRSSCASLGAVENCVALSVCNLPVVVPALAAREQEGSSEGTRTGHGFGKQTTFLSTLNTINMHVEPEESHEELSKDSRHRGFVMCECSNDSVVASSRRGEYCMACRFPRKDLPL